MKIPRKQLMELLTQKLEFRICGKTPNKAMASYDLAELVALKGLGKAFYKNGKIIVQLKEHLSWFEEI